MIIDLSHPLHNGMPVYPGTEGPLVERPFTISTHGFSEARITMVSHTGTHMDAPAHMVMEGKTLDQYPPDHFLGKAMCINLKQGKEPSIQELEQKLQLYSPEFILFRTGWSRFWGTAQYFTDFPLLTLPLASWIANQPLKGLGFDVISVDPVGASQFPNHLAFLNAGLVIVENLTKLEKLPEGNFTFQCLPLPIAKADGSPVRAVAFVEN